MRFLRSLSDGDVTRRILAPEGGEGGLGSGIEIPLSLLSGGNGNPPAAGGGNEPTDPPAAGGTGTEPTGNEPTEEQKEILERYSDKGATSFNDNGDIIDKDGNIVIAKNEVSFYPENTQIEYDGKTYKIDATGNLLDSEGNIFKKVEEVKTFIDEIQQEPQESSAIESVIKSVGIEILDENDQPIQYEDTEEGISKYVLDVIEQAAIERDRTTVISIFEDYPKLKDVYNYLKVNNGSLEGYGRFVDYGSIEYSKDNLTQSESFIRDLMRDAMPQDQLDGYIEYLKDKGQLADEGKKALDKLVEKQQQEELKADQLRKAKEADELKNLQTYWNNIKSDLDSGVIDGHQIPNVITRFVDGKKITSTRDEFYNYMSKSVNDNKESQAEVDMNNWSAEKRRYNYILNRYMAFTGGDISSLIKMQVQTQTAQSLKEKLIANKKASAGSVVITKPGSKNVSPAQIV